MWERFDEQARRAIFYSQVEAQKYGEGNVATGNLLLGLICDRGCTACLVLVALGVSLSQIHAAVAELMPAGDAYPADQLRLSPRAKRAIDLAYVESMDLNVKFIGTEHLLLGLLRESDGLAARVLTDLGVGLAETRHEVQRRMATWQGS